MRIKLRRIYYQPLGEVLYRKRKGILVQRDCIVGHIPRYLWPRIQGRKTYRPLTKVVDFDTSLWFEAREPY